MKINSTTCRIQIAFLIVTFFSSFASAQISQDSELFKTLKAKDSLMFDIGFNQCNMAQIEALLPDQFEFYHDRDGMINSKAAFIRTLNENLCSSGQNTTKRVLEEGSMEIFPLNNHGELYGAIMTGRHSFGNTIARFTNVFMLEEGDWYPTRILSYDHKIKKAKVFTDISFVKLSSSERDIYLGDYRFSPDFVLLIISEGEKMYGDAQGQKVEIKPYGNHRFLDESQTMKLTFILSESGTITGLKMEGPNGEMIADRLN